MRVLLVLFIAAVFTFGQVEIDTGLRSEKGRVYFPLKFRVVPPDVRNMTLFEGRFSLGSNLGACGELGLEAGLEYLTQSFSQIWDNLKAMALPATMYFVATYAPVASEVFTAVQWLQNITARLTTLSCDQVFNAIREMNADRSWLVRKCVEKMRERGLSTKEAYDRCLRDGVSLSDLVSFIDKNLGEKLSIKGMYRCMLKKSLGKDPKDCTRAGNRCSFAERVAALSYLMVSDIQVSADGSIRLRMEDSDIAFQLEKFRELVKRDLVSDYEKYRRELEECRASSPDEKQLERCFRDKTEAFLSSYGVEWQDFPYIVDFIQRLKAELKERVEKGADEETRAKAYMDYERVERAEETILSVLIDKVAYEAYRKALDQLYTAYYTLLAYEKAGGVPKCEL